METYRDKGTKTQTEDAAVTGSVTVNYYGHCGTVLMIDADTADAGHFLPQIHTKD